MNIIKDLPKKSGNKFSALSGNINKIKDLPSKTYGNINKIKDLPIKPSKT